MIILSGSENVECLLETKCGYCILQLLVGV